METLKTEMLLINLTKSLEKSTQLVYNYIAKTRKQYSFAPLAKI